MKITVLGGGAWGTTLAQVFADSGHQVLVYEINEAYRIDINAGRHPIFKAEINKNIKATSSLKESAEFSEIFVISLPTKYIRSVLNVLSTYLMQPVSFINTSKGLEEDSLLPVSEIVKQCVKTALLKDYAALIGPSYAEELILKKITFLTAASTNLEFAKTVQKLIENSKYVITYRTKDVIGCEVAGVGKNALAIVSGIMDGRAMGENVRAGILTRGFFEIAVLIEAYGGKKETAYGLPGIGDLMLTALSKKSRNFTCGFRLGAGETIEKILTTSVQTIEGIANIEGIYHFGKSKNLHLPLLYTAYEILFKNCSIDSAIEKFRLKNLRGEFWIICLIRLFLPLF